MKSCVTRLKALAYITLYFAVWFGVVMFLKKLLLEQYDIQFNGLALALPGAVLLAIDYGGFARGLTRVHQHPEYPRVLFNTICAGLALLVFNIFSALRRHPGKYGLGRCFLNGMRDVREQKP